MTKVAWIGMMWRGVGFLNRSQQRQQRQPDWSSLLPLLAPVQFWTRLCRSIDLGAPALELGQRKPVPILEDATGAARAGRDRTYVVAVLETQYASFHPTSMPALPEANDSPRQLEGPKETQSESA
jgi:hypothetical protein